MRYLEPHFLVRRAFNPFVAFMVRAGINLYGTRLLEVRGRKTGKTHSTVVNLLVLDGVRYLVSPRGETQWVRNLRVATEGTLRVGVRSESFTAVEVPDAEKLPIFREYLRRWWFEVNHLFDGLKRDSPDEVLSSAASGFPVFRLS